MNLAILNIIAWGIVGLVQLLSPGEIDKASYGIMWVILMLYLIINAFDKIGELNMNDWTPCNEGFPKDNKPCLITVIDKNNDEKSVDIAMRRDGEWMPRFDNNHFEVTAWIEFPEPF